MDTNHTDLTEKVNSALYDTALFYVTAYNQVLALGLPHEAAMQFAGMMMAQFVLPKKEEPDLIQLLTRLFSKGAA